SARPRSSPRTGPGSSSTASSFRGRTPASTPFRTAGRPRRRSTPPCSVRSATRWAHSGSWTSSAWTSTSRCPCGSTSSSGTRASTRRRWSTAWSPPATSAARPDGASTPTTTPGSSGPDEEAAMTQSIDMAKVAVLGFGTMGAGIAQVIADSGRQVVVLETDQERLAAGRARISAFLDEGIRRGKRTEDDKAALLERISGVTGVAELAEPIGPVDLVIESVSEDAEVKKPLLSEVAGVVGAEVPVVTNTSALSVTDLATAVPNPERVAGLHFFNPVPLMRTVEVVRAFHTDAALVDRLVSFVESLDK